MYRFKDEEGDGHDFEFVLEQPKMRAYCELLVPTSGPAGTEEGEMLRAIGKMIYRFCNDGDKLFGYGAETVGPAASFLQSRNCPLYSDMRNLFDGAESYENDYEYALFLNSVSQLILDYLTTHSGVTPTYCDMWNTDNLYKNEDERY